MDEITIYEGHWACPHGHENDVEEERVGDVVYCERCPAYGIIVEVEW